MKADCPVCGRFVGVTNARVMYGHSNPATGERCAGSGEEPRGRNLTETMQSMAEGYEPSSVAEALGPLVTTQAALGSPPPVRDALVAPGAIVSFQVGDRVTRLPNGPMGVVQALRGDEVFVHYGTTMIRDTKGEQIEQRFEGWVPKLELKLMAEPVYYGTEKEKNRALVWEPSLRGKV